MAMNGAMRSQPMLPPSPLTGDAADESIHATSSRRSCHSEASDVPIGVEFNGGDRDSPVVCRASLDDVAQQAPARGGRFELHPLAVGRVPDVDPVGGRMQRITEGGRGLAANVDGFD